MLMNYRYEYTSNSLLIIDKLTFQKVSINLYWAGYSSSLWESYTDMSLPLSNISFDLCKIGITCSFFHKITVRVEDNAYKVVDWRRYSK